MPEPSVALANRGPEALQAILRDDETHAVNQINQLTRTEMAALATAAKRLADLARQVREHYWPTVR